MTEVNWVGFVKLTRIVDLNGWNQKRLNSLNPNEFESELNRIQWQLHLILTVSDHFTFQVKKWRSWNACEDDSTIEEDKRVERTLRKLATSKEGRTSSMWISDWGKVEDKLRERQWQINELGEMAIVPSWQVPKAANKLAVERRTWLGLLLRQ